MLLFFAGMESDSFIKIAVAGRVKNILMSAYYLKFKEMPELAKGMNVLIDSGGFTARMKGAQISVMDYARFINENGVKLAFNLDTNDVKETLENQKVLNAETKAYIIPVYHFSDFADKKYRYLLDDFIQQFPMISTGGTVGLRMPMTVKCQFFDYVFARTQSKTRVHGLGVTSKPLVIRYPFYSVDSTSWIVAGKFGRSIEYCDVMNAARNSALHYTKRLQSEMAVYKKMEEDATELWKKRGVVWE